MKKVAAAVVRELNFTSLKLARAMSSQKLIGSNKFGPILVSYLPTERNLRAMTTIWIQAEKALTEGNLYEACEILNSINYGKEFKAHSIPQRIAKFRSIYNRYLVLC